MFCPQCGKENATGLDFCASCGAALGADGATNPFDVGSQTANSSGAYNSTASIVPTGPFNAAKICFKKWNKLDGRASLTEYWYWILFTFLTITVPYFLAVGLIREGGSLTAFAGIVSLAVGIWSLICLCPALHLVCRRFHDINLSAWCFLLLFVPLVNLVFCAMLMFIPGTRGPNKYGPQPVKQ